MASGIFCLFPIASMGGRREIAYAGLPRVGRECGLSMRRQYAPFAVRESQITAMVSSTVFEIEPSGNRVAWASASAARSRHNSIIDKMSTGSPVFA